MCSLTEPIEFISRPRGLGLGATPKAAEEKKKRIRKPGEEERKASSGICSLGPGVKILFLYVPVFC